jgi:hypothetical protein
MEFENNNNTPDVETNIEQPENVVPVGIARIRNEWVAAGLVEGSLKDSQAGIKPVIFSEVDGGAGIGDYTLEADTVLNQLALSEEALDRLIASGELDSILVQGPGKEPRRLLSESSVSRFLVDSAIDPHAINRAAKAMADATVAEAIKDIQAEMEELRGTQGKAIQRMKDVLLLEIRNLKEQERDLTSFVYELAEELKHVFEKKKK